MDAVGATILPVRPRQHAAPMLGCALAVAAVVLACDHSTTSDSAATPSFHGPAPHRPSKSTMPRSAPIRLALTADRTWQAPSEGTQTPVSIAVVFTNISASPYPLQPYGTTRLELAGPDGAVLAQGGGRNGSLPLPEVPELQPGQSFQLSMNAVLTWYAPAPGVQPALRLLGSDPLGGIWYYHGLGPGTYALAATFLDPRPEVGTDVNASFEAVSAAPLTVTIAPPN